ncbi:TonB-dependent receptor domain-containing protein [Piscinibacter koreensis]|uniref:TonB-dependent receptor n=1 Tax=Piscinibacter koreensis TaxID=2742824 RepID=A0A7Y6NPB6_9BURK|nr:TonB-dependent receptor [Schlegelella koreensis]NUZ06772.1 TonB-dependent receptor [Schlegelella koreensis]
MTSSFRSCARRGTTAFVCFTPFVVVSAAFAQAATSTTLDPVVVTANRTPQPLSSVLADISVVDRTTIERSGAVGVADLLARLPGIEFARSGGPGSATSVFVRGAENRHTAVYIDGVRVDSQSTGGAVWEQIPLDQIDRIEVLRGPAAAVYGSDAIGGVIQLFTRRGRGPAQPSASLTYGTYRTGLAQAGVSGSAQGIDYSLSASHGRSDGFDSRTPGAAGHNPDEDGWRRNSVRGRVGYEIDAVHRIEASVLASNLRSHYDGFTPGADDWNRHALRTGNVAWHGRWTDDATTRLQLGRTRSTYETQPSFYRTETTLGDYTLQHEQRIGPNTFTGTLERRDDELRNPAVAPGVTLEGKRHQNAVGLGWRGDFGAHGFQAHVRRDDDSEFGAKSTGSLAWGWAFLPQWRMTVAAANSFRVPTLYQRFSQYGNAALVPERGRNVELGLRWAAGTDTAVSLVAWHNKVTNLIAFGDPGPCPDEFGCYVNVGRARLRGVTLAGNTRLGGVTLRGSLDWHDPRNVDTDKVLQRRARRLATFGAETQLAGWNVGADIQAAGKRYEDAANTQRMGGYALLNVFVSKVLVPGLTLEGRIDNVGNKDYELARNYATAGRNGQVTLRWTTP